MQFQAFAPQRPTILPGESVAWTNVVRAPAHGDRERRLVRHRRLPRRPTFSYTFAAVGSLRLPLHDPPDDDGRGRRAPRDPRSAADRADPGRLAGRVLRPRRRPRRAGEHRARRRAAGFHAVATAAPGRRRHLEGVRPGDEHRRLPRLGGRRHQLDAPAARHRPHRAGARDQARRQRRGRPPSARRRGRAPAASARPLRLVAGPAGAPGLRLARELPRDGVTRRPASLWSTPTAGLRSR